MDAKSVAVATVVALPASIVVVIVFVVVVVVDGRSAAEKILDDEQRRWPKSSDAVKGAIYLAPRLE